jgi:hypothetical protein
VALFEAWLKPRSGGLLGRLVKMQTPPGLQRVALSGLQRAAGAEAEALLGRLADHGEGGVAERAAAALAGRSRGTGDKRE